jgi:hypothetical protein
VKVGRVLSQVYTWSIYSWRGQLGFQDGEEEPGPAIFAKEGPFYKQWSDVFAEDLFVFLYI